VPLIDVCFSRPDRIGVSNNPVPFVVEKPDGKGHAGGLALLGDDMDETVF
jgi:hypothetical protein